LIDRCEIALLDVREEGRFAQGHPLFAASLPLGRIALEIYDRVPRRSTPVVVYDDGEGLSVVAAERLRALGYSDVSLLDGGLDGWRLAGGEIFRDVNTPSKAFGELVEARRHTPSLTAHEVKALLDAKSDVVILDARRFEEYRTMSIPTAVSVPGAELVYRAQAAAPSTSSLIVVNCAGRTRSIIGAQSLVNAGIPNRVAALRNGTIGWMLAGFALDRGRTQTASPVTPDTAARRRAAARAVADRAGVNRVAPHQVDAWTDDASRTTYRFDVRSPEEFDAGHPAGFRSAPGGQLVQETDVFAPVRGARLVLWDPEQIRADMTASWLAQMGWEVHVLDGLDARDATERGPWKPSLPPGAERLTTDSIDVYKRPYEGADNEAAAMQAYLEWEYGLVAQLERDGTHRFHVI
jgi:rhodanese-related sulfurtransferase